MNADVHSLAGPYALDALPPDEAELFELHLRECGSCRQEVDELRATASRLGAATAETPPDGLKRRVMDEIGRTRQLPPVVTSITEPSLPARTWRRRQVVSAAAAAVVLVAGGAAAAEMLRSDSDDDAADELAAIIGAPDAQTVRGTVSGGGRVTLVVSKRSAKAVVVLDELPAQPDDRTYQLWMIRGATPYSAGTVDMPRPGRATRIIASNVRGAEGFGLTVEPAGGSKKPTPPIIAQLPLES